MSSQTKLFLLFLERKKHRKSNTNEGRTSHEISKDEKLYIQSNFVLFISPCRSFIAFQNNIVVQLFSIQGIESIPPFVRAKM